MAHFNLIMIKITRTSKGYHYTKPPEIFMLNEWIFRKGFSFCYSNLLF